MFHFFKKLNNSSATITSAALVIGGLSLLSRFLGVFRDRVLAGQFGAGDILDAYYAAFRLPDLVFNLIILGAVSAGLIPVFTALLTRRKEDEAWKLINSILNLLSFGLIVVCAILFVCARQLVPLITPGFSGEKMELVIRLSRIMFLSPLFLGLSAIFGSILQSFKRFLIYSIAPLFYNLGIIFGALYLVQPFGIIGLAWGVVLGAFLHMIVQLWPLFSVGYHYSFTFNWRDKNVMAVLKMMVPRTLALVISQVNFVIITVFASTMAVGSLAIFNLSNNLQNFPLGVFGASLAIAALPTLSALVANKKTNDFVATISETLRQILFFIIPTSVLFYVLRAQIVRVILGSGQFNWENTRLTAACLGIFCFGLFAQGVYPLIIRAFYALHNTKTPFYIGVVTLVVNIFSMLFFRWVLSFENWFSFFTTAILKIPDLFGNSSISVLALPAAITVSSIFDLVALTIALKVKIGRLDGRKILDSIYRIVFASLGAGLVAYALLQFMDLVVPTEKFLGIFAQGFIAGAVGLLGYWALGVILKMEEMEVFIKSLKKKMLKSAKVADKPIDPVVAS